MEGDGVAPRVETEHLGPARVGPQEAEQYPDGGGLAGAVGPQEPVHLAGCHGEIEAVERTRGAERLHQFGRDDSVSS
jgi:hypothetical protein